MRQLSSLLVGIKKTPAVLIVSSMIFCFISCNNEKKEPVANAENPGSDSSKTPKPAAALTGNFPYLSIEKKSLDTLFGQPNNCIKLVFKFQFEDPNATPSLVAYGAKTFKKFIANTPQDTLKKLSISTTLSGEFYLGNLELTKRQWSDLLKKYNNESHLVLMPTFSATFLNNVAYKVAWANLTDVVLTDEYLKALVYPEELNPSPPAPPGE